MNTCIKRSSKFKLKLIKKFIQLKKKQIFTIENIKILTSFFKKKSKISQKYQKPKQMLYLPMEI